MEVAIILSLASIATVFFLIILSLLKVQEHMDISCFTPEILSRISTRWEKPWRHSLWCSYQEIKGKIIALLFIFFIIISPADAFPTNCRYSDIVLQDSSLARTHPNSDEKYKRWTKRVFTAVIITILIIGLLQIWRKQFPRIPSPPRRRSKVLPVPVQPLKFRNHDF